MKTAIGLPLSFQRNFYAEPASASAENALEHVPKKLTDFFDKDMLQLIDFERILIDRMIPCDGDAL